MRPLAAARRMPALLVTATVVLIDQATKMVATRDPSGIVLPARNPAYALGIVGGPAPALIAGSIVALCTFVIMVKTLASRFDIPIIMSALVAGGMIGNTLDRIRFGSVRDFLVTPWAIVNLADVAVAAGIIGVVLTLAGRAPRLRAEVADTRSVR
jgi:lipoprotein signal peptidase